jgi:hypothetical protein
MFRLPFDVLEQKKGLFFVIFILAYIVCAMNVPVSIYSLAGHDDALFMQNAYRILKGEWLGDAYTQMTLAKGPGFSLFLAANAVIGIPITLSIALFYAFSCWLLTNTLIRLGLPVLVGLVLFTLMLFHPEMLPTRIIRDNIYPGLSLIVLAAAIDLILLNQRRWFVLCFYGGAIALFWITREEGIWMIPALGLILLYRVVDDWLSGNKRNLIPLAKNGLLLGVFIALPILVICSLNYYKYGAFLTVDFKDPHFAKSMSLLNSIESNVRISHVPVNKAQREIAYSVSPAFAELEGYLEGTGTHWTSPGCNVYPETCGDYAGGWFMWVYRDAVFDRGYYKDFEQASGFYRRVAAEIGKACKTGKIQCRSGSLGFLPNLSKAEIAEVPSVFVAFYKRLTVQEKVHLDGGPSMDRHGILNSVRLFLRYPLSTPSLEENSLLVRGWYYNEESLEPWLTLECSSSAVESIARSASPDIAAFKKNPEATQQRFNFRVPAQESCSLITDSGKKISVNSIYQQASGPVAIEPGSTLFIDFAERVVPRQVKKTAETIKYGLVGVYKLILPVLFWLGFIACVISVIYSAMRKIMPDFLLVCALVAWALVSTRAVILVLIDISSFPAINALYIGPAFPLIVVATVLSIFSFYSTVNTLLRNK